MGGEISNWRGQVRPKTGDVLSAWISFIVFVHIILVKISKHSIYGGLWFDTVPIIFTVLCDMK